MIPRRLDFNGILVHHLDPDHVNISMIDSGIFMSASLTMMGISRPIESDEDLFGVASEIADRAGVEFCDFSRAITLRKYNHPPKDTP